MKKIVFSLAIIAAAAAVVIGGTTAFFSDTESSNNNTFTAGSIDLKVSNDSYVTDANGILVKSENTSWVSGDLDPTINKFFNFNDLKPGDVGEDTIDLTVSTNDAWACAALTLTSNKDNDCSEPENEAEGKDSAGAPVCGSGDKDWNGNLAQGIEFVWWNDDGDNVLEVDEEATKYYLGPDSITNLLGEGKKLELTFADQYLNFFDGTRVDRGEKVLPLKGGQKYHIGKAWCFGDMTLTPISEGDGGPIKRGTGIRCNGNVPDNESQTDSLTADLSFTAVQSRNNANFVCPEHVRLQS